MGLECSQLEKSPCGCCGKNIDRVTHIDSHAAVLDRHQRAIHHDDDASYKDFYSILPGPAGRLHQGAYVIVYKCRHKRSNALRALKQVRATDIDLKTWHEEVAVLQDCDHPHICRLYETFVERRYLSQVLELCVGKDLYGLASAGKECLTETTVSWLVRQIVGAVGCLHSKGVCHTQLKPECFLFTKILSKKMPLSEMSLKLVDVGLLLKYGTTTKESLGRSPRDSPGRSPRSPRRKSTSPKQSPRGGKSLGMEKRSAKRLATTTAVTARSYCQAPEQVDAYSVASWAFHGDKCDVWAVGAIAYFLTFGRWHKIAVSVKAHDLAGLVSESAASFIAQCLVGTPTGRSTAEELQSDPWLISALEAYEESLDKEQSGQTKGRRPISHQPLMNADAILKGFEQMAQLNDFERAAITAVAHHLPEDKTHNLRKVFARLDTNGDGHLSAEELHRGLEDALGDSTARHFAELLANIDTDGNGTIDYTEFIAATFAMKSSLNDEICEAAFRVFDKDASGAVTKSEIQETMGDGADGKKLHAFADHDGDGQLDMAEFKRLIFNGKAGASGQAHDGALPESSAKHSARHAIQPPKPKARSPGRSPGQSPRTSGRRPREGRDKEKGDEDKDDKEKEAVAEKPADDDKTAAFAEAEDTDAEEVEQASEKPKRAGLLRSLSKQVVGSGGGGGFASKLVRAFTKEVKSPTAAAAPADMLSPKTGKKQESSQKRSKISEGFGKLKRAMSRAEPKPEEKEVKPGQPVEFGHFASTDWQPKESECTKLLSTTDDGIYAQASSNAKKKASPRRASKTPEPAEEMDFGKVDTLEQKKIADKAYFKESQVTADGRRSAPLAMAGKLTKQSPRDMRMFTKEFDDKPAAPAEKKQKPSPSPSPRPSGRQAPTGSGRRPSKQVAVASAAAAAAAGGPSPRMSGRGSQGSGRGSQAEAAPHEPAKMSPRQSARRSYR